MKKKAFCLLIIVLLLFSACTNNNNNTKNNENKKDLNPVTIQLWTPVDKDVIEGWVNDFQIDNPNVTIVVQKEPWDEYWSKLLLAFETGIGPDIFYQNTNYLYNTMKYSLSYDKEIIEKEDFDEEYGSISMHTIDDQLYYIPMLYYTGALLYNEDKWEEAGLTIDDLPKTWEELYKLQTRLQGFSYNGKESRLGFVLNYQQGMPIFNDRDKTNINNEIFSNTLGVMDKLNQHINSKPAWKQLADGEVTIIYTSGEDYAKLKREYPQLNIGVANTPSLDNKGTMVELKELEVSFGISKLIREEKKDWALKFIKYVATDDQVLQNYAIYKGAYPVKSSLSKEEQINSNPLFKIQGQYIKNAIYPGPLPYLLLDVYYNIFEKALYEKTDINKVLREGQKEADEVVSEYNIKSIEEENEAYDKLTLK